MIQENEQYSDLNSSTKRERHRIPTTRKAAYALLRRVGFDIGRLEPAQLAAVRRCYGLDPEEGGAE
ncbi:hypothetical protein [Methanoculleus sp.]|jgi:hypothetical protein|uniref:hypothetical protein n=1 Tax=Methanoculleus sp. TaxID=90427 RepID=UPI001BD60D0E|nr:hypothetical protein [Methanoculleus sp.]